MIVMINHCRAVAKSHQSRAAKTQNFCPSTISELAFPMHRLLFRTIEAHVSYVHPIRTR